MQRPLTSEESKTMFFTPLPLDCWKRIKPGYGACGGAAPSALFKVMIRQPDSLFSSSCETPQSNFVVVFFLKAWPTDPIGSSQEPRLHATIALLGSVSSALLLLRVHLTSWKKDYVGCMTSYDPRFGQ